MPKILTLWLVGLFIITGTLIFIGCGEQANETAQQTVETLTDLDKVQAGQQAKKDLAVAQCQSLWQQRFAAGEELSGGPCLSEEIIPDWSCDIAQRLRSAADDRPENQCQAYLQGKTHHYVELDLSGQLIKAQ